MGLRPKPCQRDTSPWNPMQGAIRCLYRQAWGIMLNILFFAVGARIQ
jgi:hypothetical protein